MAVGTGPRKELDGLVFDLDFGNPKTFSGIGTTIKNTISTATSEINGAITAQTAITAKVFLGFKLFDRELFLGSKNAGSALRKYDKRIDSLP